MSLLSAPLVVLDTETTGFPSKDWSRVIELGAVLLDVDGKEVSSWSSLVKPDVLDERADGALAVNHITREMLDGHPDTGSAAMSFLAWLSSHGLPKVTAFNVGFDRPMLEKMGLQVEWGPCVMLAAHKVMGSYNWPKLSAAAEHFNVPVEGDAHRALTDARTAARIVVAIQSKAKGLPMPVYDIIDRPGPLPDEEPETNGDPPEEVEYFSPLTKKFMSFYDVSVKDETPATKDMYHGVYVDHSVWLNVVHYAQQMGCLQEISINVNRELITQTAKVYISKGHDPIIVQALSDPSKDRVLLVLSDLL